MLKGKKLQFGDTIGLIGPSGAVREAGAVDQAIAYMRELGFKVKVGESAQAYRTSGSMADGEHWAALDPLPTQGGRMNFPLKAHSITTLVIPGTVQFR